ncbi:unnamed protein product [Chrysoparadoxa australica]
MFQVGDDYAHPFEADSLMNAVSFIDGRAYYRSRFVQTEGYQEEQAAGKRLYRGFSNLPGGWLKNVFNVKFKNPANTNAVYHGNKLLALWEAGLPHALDPLTLETIALDDLGILTRQEGPNKEPFSAHPILDPESKCLVNFGSTGLKTRVMEFDDKLELVRDKMFDFSRWSMTHDFGVTQRYYTFYQGAFGFNIPAWVLGREMAQALHYDKAIGSQFLLVPRDGDGPEVTIPCPDPGFSFHIANSYDCAETGDVVVDLVECEGMAIGVDLGKDSQGRPKPLWEMDYGRDAANSALVRYRLNTTTGECSKVPLLENYCDFVTINSNYTTKKHRFIYASIGSDTTKASPLQGLVKVDAETGESSLWFPEPHQFLSEPAWADKAGSGNDQEEDDGYLMTFLFDGKDMRSEVVLFDAKDITKGPICRMGLRNFVPHGLHGTFCGKAIYTVEEIKAAFQKVA